LGFPGGFGLFSSVTPCSTTLSSTSIFSKLKQSNNPLTSNTCHSEYKILTWVTVSPSVSVEKPNRTLQHSRIPIIVVNQKQSSCATLQSVHAILLQCELPKSRRCEVRYALLRSYLCIMGRMERLCRPTILDFPNIPAMMSLLDS